jgi:hypothetical protein
MAGVQRVRSRGGGVLGNGPALTAELLHAGVPRMVEMQTIERRAFEGDLSTPLAYAGQRTDFGNWIRALDKAKLLVGTRSDYEHELSRFVFPFTPIELYAGFLLGRERIIATHSGQYGWGQRNLGQYWHFDNTGRRTSQTAWTDIGLQARTTVTVRAGEAMVLERIPVHVHPRAGKAAVTGVHYDSQELRFEVLATGPADVVIEDGMLRLVQGKSYELGLGRTSRRVRAGLGNAIRFGLQAGHWSVRVTNPES